MLSNVYKVKIISIKIIIIRMLKLAIIIIFKHRMNMYYKRIRINNKLYRLN